ncbi:MAG: hypothetical protein AB3N14_01900 [Flavobacteriaceae bacterium]
MDNTIYYVVGALAVVYLLISWNNRRTAKRRKSRGFMEGYERKDKKKE